MSGYLRFSNGFSTEFDMINIHDAAVVCVIARFRGDAQSMVTVLVALFHLQRGLSCMVNWLY